MAASQIEIAQKPEVVLVCGGKQFRVEKDTFTSCSSVFKRMLEGSFIEASAETIALNVEEHVMEKLVHFMNTKSVIGIVFDNVLDVVKLMESAHYYLMDELCTLCCHKLGQMATVKDYPALCIMHKLYATADTETMLTKFMQDNYLKFLQENVHVNMDYDEFRMVIKVGVSSLLIPTHRVVEQVLKWTEDVYDEETDGYLTELFSLINTQELSKSSIKSLMQNEGVRRNADVLAQLVNELVLTPEKSCALELNRLIKSLRICQWNTGTDGEVLYSQTRFSDGVCEVENRATDFPFASLSGVSCINHHDHVYLIGEIDGRSVITNYNVRLNTFASLPELPICCFKPDKVGAVDDCVYVLGEPEETGQHVRTPLYYWRCKCFANDDTWAVVYIPSMLDEAVVVGGGHELVVIETYVQYVSEYEEHCYVHLVDKDRVRAIELKEKVFVDAFTGVQSSMLWTHTICSRDKLCTYFNKYMNVFDTNSESVQHGYGGGLMGWTNRFFTLNGCKISRFVVVRQNRRVNSSECHKTSNSFYGLWDIDEKKFSSGFVPTSNKFSLDSVVPFDFPEV